MKKSFAFLLCLILISLNQALAQKNIDSLPGNPALVSAKEELKKLSEHDSGKYKYSIEDFFKTPKQNSFKLSPNGEYLSFRESDEQSKNHVYVKNIKTGEKTRIIKEEKDLILDYDWVNDNRLIFVKDNGGDENYHLYAADIDGGNLIELTSYDKVKVEILDLLKSQKDYMIIKMNKDNLEVFEPYIVNILTGELTKLLENTDISNPIMDYFFTKDGDLAAYTKQVDGTKYVLYYKNPDNGSFQEVIKTTWKDKFSIVGFDYSLQNVTNAYVISNIENNTDEIILYDLKKKRKIKTVFSNPTFDISGLHQSAKRNYQIDYYFYTADKLELEPASNLYQTIIPKLKKRFGQMEFDIVSITDKEDKLLIYVTSDKIFGTYYLYNVTDEKFTELYNLMPILDPEDMAKMKCIRFKSQDGLTIYGYLTIPNMVNDGGKVPLIVSPHGGPYGPRDKWSFNAETQLFASRGYATLWINFRGSGGYGKAFFQAGNNQVGRKMLDDLEDGIEYVKSLHIIDENRIAIYGGSYGGLATLQSLVRTPELYVCGVDYVGVSNLFTLYNSFPPYWKPYLPQVYEQWYDINIPEEKEIMKLVSPVLNVEKIKSPLFVIQGANDPRVNINESDQIVESLRNRGFEVPYMVKYNEGHGFQHEENKIELYYTMMGFFAKYLNNAN